MTTALTRTVHFLVRWVGGLLLLLVGAGLVALLLSYDPGDPSLNNATDAVPQNLLGGVGAYIADFLLQGFGLGATLLVPALFVWALRTLCGAPLKHHGRALLATSLAALLGAGALGLIWPAPVGPLGAGSGGVLGFAVGGMVASMPLPTSVDPALVALVTGLVLGLLAIVFLFVGFDLRRSDFAWVMRLVPRRSDAEVLDEDDIATGDDAVSAEPVRSPPPVQEVAPQQRPERSLFRPKAVREAPERPAPARSVERTADGVDLPTLSLLKPAPRGQTQIVDQATLEQNARTLESVLEDYGVKGQIVGLSQGPVVTLYELEPAPGIKASRVIGLADDIARSMCAVSARVAVIPGRNVIGIELPNAQRDMVSLSEMIASDAFQSSNGTLPIILGKDISGLPVIADLAPMPHLLIAGTTGSGKSVGLNAMILSLLYRLTPEQCRMIMIDPKMLELSVYDDIPHLLSPVVTEPQKAVRALKWAVEQMEDRYRNMAHINVRSLSGYNERVREALKTGKNFTKRVQTGWDDEGKPQFEEVTLPLEPLPLIVVIVDELADLMMTAGKEVEFLIQRLAQKARAAGIHLIMATQRPSVDVITGVIKANLPTRISFQVTSKIDSRTILGEQGAEQLLGKGDMLYMPGGKQVVRVHGPFVSDEEVESVAMHWKAQGSPDYVSSVTEEPEGPDGFEGISGSGKAGANADGDPLQQAIQIVASSRKATISYLQRQLRVGYNSAARLIEQMEEMGLVSSPDHVGRREVLMDEAGNRLP